MARILVVLLLIVAINVVAAIVAVNGASLLHDHGAAYEAEAAAAARFLTSGESPKGPGH